ncbi:hypothetical protein V2J09_003876 [Rumex salicifolius]
MIFVGDPCFDQLPSQNEQESISLVALMEHPAVISAAVAFKATPEKLFSQHGSNGQTPIKHVYVFQREFATVDPTLVDVHLVGGFDDAPSQMETATGSIIPASFDATTRCPDEVVRRIRVSSSFQDSRWRGKLLDTYDTHTDRLWDYLIQHPNLNETYPMGKARIFKRVSGGEWAMTHQRRLSEQLMEQQMSNDRRRSVKACGKREEVETVASNEEDEVKGIVMQENRLAVDGLELNFAEE